MFVHTDFEGLKVISVSVGKDGDRKRVPALRSHGNKHISESSGPALFQFNPERELVIGKTRATHKAFFSHFNSSENMSWYL